MMFPMMTTCTPVHTVGLGASGSAFSLPIFQDHQSHGNAILCEFTFYILSAFVEVLDIGMASIINKG